MGEIESAIERLPNPSPMTVKLIKTIGLLGIVGEGSVNLKASKALLRYALDDGTETFQYEVDGSAESFESALRCWRDVLLLSTVAITMPTLYGKGSDIDIEARLREARAHLDPNLRLPITLSTLMQPQPLIARRHLFVTGTLRYFAVRYTDLEGFDARICKCHLMRPTGLCFTPYLQANLRQNSLLKRQLKHQSQIEKRVLIAIPQSIGSLRDAVLELWCLGWVEDNTPELEGDTQQHVVNFGPGALKPSERYPQQLTALFGGNYSCPLKLG